MPQKNHGSLNAVDLLTQAESLETSLKDMTQDIRTLVDYGVVSSSYIVLSRETTGKSTYFLPHWRFIRLIYPLQNIF